MPTGQSDQALTRSPHAVSPVGDGGFGVSNGRRLSMDTISVTVSHNDTAVTVTAEGGYSPDLLDDLCRRAAAGVAALMIQLLEAVEDE